MGSSAKTGNFFIQGSQEHFLHKSAIWDRTPPIYISNAVYMCAVGFGVPNLQTELNYLNSFKSYCIFSDFVVPMWSLWFPCHPHIIPIIPRRLPCGPHTPPMTVVSIDSTLHGPHTPAVPTLSPLSPRHLCCLHVIPIIPMSSPHHLEGSYIIPNPPDSC